MPLSEGENTKWNAAISGLEDLVVDFQPVRLHVDQIVNSPAELWAVIENNRIQGRLSDEHIPLAIEFFGNILASGNAKAVVAELPYEEADEGLEIILKFPNAGEEHGKA